MKITQATLHRILPKVERAAYNAGRIIMGFYDRKDPVTITKADGSPVTTADYQSSTLLEEALSRILPWRYFPVVSEENQIEATGNCWSIDPLDGTQEFLDEIKSGLRLGGFCVKIDLQYEGETVLGAVHCPVQNITFSTFRHGPAIRSDAARRCILTLDAPDFASPLRSAFNVKSNPISVYEALRDGLSLRSVFMEETPDTLPGIPRNLRVAAGITDLHRGRGGYGWDLAADALILKNAGGILFSADTGQELQFDTPRILHGAYIAARHPALRTKLFPHL